MLTSPSCCSAVVTLRPAKLLMGTSGFVVDAVGYPWFFLYTAALSIPALLLLWWLNGRMQFAPGAAPTPAGRGN